MSTTSPVRSIDLEMRDIAKPVVKDDEVLVRIRAAGLHVGDCFAVRGSPFVVRVATGLLRPKRGIPGFDGAGEVEAAGAAVSSFRPGDAVFGQSDRACAEYASVTTNSRSSPPASRSTKPPRCRPLRSAPSMRCVTPERCGPGRRS